MTKKKNKRPRPSRREAERQEQQQAHQPKRPRRDDSDGETPFGKQAAAHQRKPQQKQQQQQAQRNGGGAAARPQQQGQQKQKQKQQQPAAAAAGAAAAPRKKKAKAAAAAEQQEEDDTATDSYNTTPRDGLAIAFGESSVPVAATFAAAAAAPAPSSQEPPLSTPAGLELDSGLTSQSFFEWLIWPLSIDSFYANYFEKKPLFISRAKVAERARSYATLVTTRKDLADYLPAQEDDEDSAHYSPSHAAGAAASKPPTRKDLKTQANALPSERVTEVPVTSLVDRIASNSDKSQQLLSHYYSNWFSIPDIHSLLQDPSHDIRYRRDVDITRYRNGVRETLNPAGQRATDNKVRHFLNSEDCSLRFLCPQKYSPRLWRMLSLLDEVLGMQTGANSYYTPKGTQGFAPHYDDVDILVIQTEGAKRWRLYPPRHPSELLPSVSSRNVAQSEIGAPIMDILLCAGDFLYAPRGTIHQCVASTEEPSLHVTLSTCLNSSWSDFFKAMLPRMLDLASEESVAMRQSLPHRYDRYMGVMHADDGSGNATARRKGGRRAAFMDRFMELLTELVDDERMPFDAAADQLQTAFMHGRVPPALDRKHATLREKQGLLPITGAPAIEEEEAEGDDKVEAEEDCAAASPAAAAATPAQGTSATKAAAAAASKVGKAASVKLSMNTCIRLVKDGAARLTTSPKGDSLLLHHILANSRLYQGAPLAFLEFPLGYAGALETLLSSYPRFVSLSQLPLPEPDDEDEDGEGEIDEAAAKQDLFELVQALLDEGLLDVMSNVQSVPEQLRKHDDEEEEEEEDEQEEEEEGEEEEDDHQDMEDGEDEEDDEEEQ